MHMVLWPAGGKALIAFLSIPGKLWSRSLKLAYTLLNKLGTKNEPVLKPGDRVRNFITCVLSLSLFKENIVVCFCACYVSVSFVLL